MHKNTVTQAGYEFIYIQKKNQQKNNLQLIMQTF